MLGSLQDGSFGCRNVRASVELHESQRRRGNVTTQHRLVYTIIISWGNTPGWTSQAIRPVDAARQPISRYHSGRASSSPFKTNFISKMCDISYKISRGLRASSFTLPNIVELPYNKYAKFSYKFVIQGIHCRENKLPIRQVNRIIKFIFYYC